MYHKQQHYDILHHRKRVMSLKAIAKTRKLNWHEKEMLAQSERNLAHPETMTRSVDLDNSRYLAELDYFHQSEGEM